MTVTAAKHESASCLGFSSLAYDFELCVRVLAPSTLNILKCQTRICFPECHPKSKSWQVDAKACKGYGERIVELKLVKLHITVYSHMTDIFSEALHANLRRDEPCVAGAIVLP